MSVLEVDDDDKYGAKSKRAAETRQHVMPIDDNEKKGRLEVAKPSGSSFVSSSEDDESSLSCALLTNDSLLKGFVPVLFFKTNNQTELVHALCN